MKEVFISWSGEKANTYARYLEEMLNRIFNKRANTFYSGILKAELYGLTKLIKHWKILQ